MPLVWVLYTYPLGLPESAVTMIALKQTINGISNVVIANILFQVTPIGRIKIIQTEKNSGDWPLHSAINNIIAAFILVPTLGTMIASNIDELDEIQEKLDHHVLNSAHQGVLVIQTALNLYTSILRSLAKSDLKPDRRQEWIGIIQKWEQNIFPSLKNIEIADGDGNVIASYPQKIAKYSEYAEQIRMLDEEPEILTNFYEGNKIVGKHFSAIIQAADDKVLIATFSNKLFDNLYGNFSANHLLFDVVDGSGNIVMGTSIAAGHYAESAKRCWLFQMRFIVCC